MKTLLSGVQPSGKIHLGNYLGAIKQHIELQKEYKCYIFIADLHALTTVKDPKLMQEQSLEIAMTYLALGLNPEKTIFFKQSYVSEHAELCWIFDCITKMPFLERAHAWKDAKNKKNKETTVGLFNYPILQAADILLYEPDIVPVGKDQKQHIEMTRDIAINFNNIFGKTFKIPEPFIKKEIAVIPGTDGQKMSKSYKNTIDIFANENELKKQIMGIQTDSTSVESPKNPSNCNVFKLYKFLASKEEIKDLEEKYKKGGFGYGDAKKLLLSKTLKSFEEARDSYSNLLNKKSYIQEIIEEGSKKAKEKASSTLNKAKEKIGYLS